MLAGLAVALAFYVIVANVNTAPVYHHNRGPTYTINGISDHRKPYLEVRNSTYHGAGPREEARAMCSVKTAEVNATANATITRRLHGVVTSRELHSSIQRLEVIIFGQMQQLWQSLDALRSQLSSESHGGYPDRRTMSFREKVYIGRWPEVSVCASGHVVLSVVGRLASAALMVGMRTGCSRHTFWPTCTNKRYKI